MLQTVKSDLRLYPSKNLRERENNGGKRKKIIDTKVSVTPIFLSTSKISPISFQVPSALSN